MTLVWQYGTTVTDSDHEWECRLHDEPEVAGKPFVPVGHGHRTDVYACPSLKSMLAKHAKMRMTVPAGQSIRIFVPVRFIEGPGVDRHDRLCNACGIRYGKHRGGAIVNCPGDNGQWAGTVFCELKPLAPPVIMASAWNGRCLRCGKNTYMGFTSMEHEGGACPQRA